MGYRCPREPQDSYHSKRGSRSRGRKCICNGLMAGVGLGQDHKNGYQEKPLVTSGDDLARIAIFLKKGKPSYGAAEVIQYLLGAFPVEAGFLAV